MWPFNIQWNDISWEATGAMFAGIGSLIAAATFVASAFVAWRSYQQWKEKERYLEDRRLAIEILSAFEEGRKAIKALRQHAFFFWSDIDFDKDAIETMRSEIDTHIVENEDIWEKIDALLIRAKIIFGIEVNHSLFFIVQAKMDISRACRTLGFKITEKIKEKELSKIIPKSDKMDEDKYYSRILVAQKTLERILTPYIRSDSKPKKSDEAVM